MPKIPYRAERFNALPPTTKLPTSQPGVSTSGTKSVTMTEVTAHAISVGDTGVFAGKPPRPQQEVAWRRSIILSNIEEHAGHFKKSDSYERLDPSEKSAVSYFLGMTQCAIMADKLLAADTTVHVDSLIKLLGNKLPSRSRPDLVGYTSTPSSLSVIGRYLLEAKGRTHGFSPGTVSTALGQLSCPPPEVSKLVSSNPIYAASLAYFEPITGATPIWQSYLEDPEPPGEIVETELSDQEFKCFVRIAQLLPIQRAITDILQTQETSHRRDSSTVTAAIIPGTEAYVTLPTSVYLLLQSIDGPIIEPEARRRFTSEYEEASEEIVSPDTLHDICGKEGDIVTLKSGFMYFESSPMTASSDYLYKSDQ